MKVLVTGGTGYIGSHTVVELILAGHQVEILDNLANSKGSVVDRIEMITDTRPPLHQLDLGDATALNGVIAQGEFDAVLHFAGLKAVGESVEHPLTYYQVNVGGSTTLFRVMARHQVKTVVFSSSATVYGDPGTIPVSENTPTGSPANPYGWSKLMVEQILRDTRQSDPSWSVAVLRYFNPIGAHESGLIGEDPSGVPTNLLPFIAQVAVGRLPRLEVFGADYPTRDGTGVRDYIHVVDLAKGHVAALHRLATDPGYHVWNLGTGSGTTVLELAGAFERASGAKIPRQVVERRPGDIAAIWADVSKAQRELGWRAVRDIDDMCVDAWRWQRYAEGLDPLSD